FPTISQKSSRSTKPHLSRRSSQNEGIALMYPLTLARNAPHPYSSALFYDFLLSEQGQKLIAKEGRVVAHPTVDPLYPRMKELQGLLGTSRVQLNTVEQNHKLYKDGLQILDEIILKRKSSSM